MTLIPRPLHPLIGRSVPEDLPVALPISLTELPIVRAGALRYEADGSLAPECLQSTGTMRIGQYRIEYSIGSSDPNVPLPYGYDAEILYAVFEMGVQDRVWEGERIGRLDRTPLDRFKQIIGGSKHGDFNTRVRNALERFAAVGIHTVIEEFPEVSAITSGSESPRVPRSGIAKPRHIRTHVLSVGYQEDGSTIDYIQIDPTWVRQLLAGDASWIHLPVFTKLGPTAQRIYSITAAHTARGKDLCSYSQEELVVLCGISGRDRDQRTELKKTLASLSETGVIEQDWSISKVSVGKYEVHWQAGPTMAVARLLRGAGMADLQDTRVQLLLLASIGISGKEARQMVSDTPDDALWGLYYYQWTRETQPESEQIKSPRAFIRWAIKEGRNLSGEVAFYNWYKRKTAAHTEPKQVVAPPQIAPTPRPLPDDAWGTTLARFEAEAPAGTFSIVRLSRLRSLKDNHAVIALWSEFARDRIHVWTPRLTEILSDVLGQLVTVEFVVVEPDPNPQG